MYFIYIYMYNRSIKRSTGKLKGQMLIPVLEFSLPFNKQTHTYKNIQILNYPNTITRCLLKSDKIQDEEKRV